MSSPGAELRKATSRRGYLHPFRSFSTSRVPRRFEPSPAREDKPKKESGSGGGGGFFSQLKRSFTLGHRSSSSSSSTAAAAAREGAGVLAPAAGTASNGAPWGRRVRNGLSKPLKVVRTSYVDCMMGIAEDPRVEGLGGMGFHHPNSPADAFKFSASARRFQPSASSPAAGQDVPYVSDEHFHAVLRSSKHHAHLLPSS